MERFRSRPLEGEYPYVYARVEKRYFPIRSAVGMCRDGEEVCFGHYRRQP